MSSRSASIASGAPGRRPATAAADRVTARTASRESSGLVRAQMQCESSSVVASPGEIDRQVPLPSGSYATAATSPTGSGSEALVMSNRSVPPADQPGGRVDEGVLVAQKRGTRLDRGDRQGALAAAGHGGDDENAAVVGDRR